MSVREKFVNDFNSISNKFPDNISICYASDFKNSVGITYFELNKVSNELCRHFVKIFGGKPQYVGVSVSDYFFLPCIILGIWKSGCCFAGIATQYTRKNNLDFLNFLEVKYFINDSDNNDWDGEVVFDFFINERRYFIWERHLENNQTDLQDICYGIMTSGSTGEPKIIQVPWSCILPNAVELSEEFQVTKHDCIFQGSPYSFDPFFIELFMTFLTGCTIMIVSTSVKLNPSDLLNTLFKISNRNKLPPLNCNYTEYKNHFHINIQQVIKKNVSILQMTPSVFKRWTDDQIKEFILSANSSLRILILGGEKFPSEILKLKSNDNKTRIYNIYGITEISCWAFLNKITNLSNNRISVGQPLNNIIYKITENGDFHIGSTVRVCFVNKEKISQVRNTVFRKTGDIVELSDGEIYYAGRTNQIVKKYGMKINLTDIEFYFSNENALIKECFAIFNEDNLKLGLFYVPVMNQKTDLSYKVKTFDDFCKDHYRIPVNDIKDIEKPDYFIEMSKTPLNSHGKCDRQQLLEFLKGIKTQKSGIGLENKFKQLWIEVLGVKNDNLLSASFIESGGNSVLGLNLINNLEDEGFNVPQNFITVLLGEKSYEECLKCLLSETETPRKKFKFKSEAENIRLSVEWKFDLGKCVDATPAYFTHEGQEKLVIGSHSFKLSCLNPKTGSDIWTIFLGDRIESGFRTTKDGSKGFIGCYDHYVYCLDCSDGRVIWKFKTDDMVKSTPCLSTDEKILYVGSYDTNLYCLSVAEGQPKAILKLSNGGIFSSGIISDTLNNFYIGTLDGTCVAIGQETNEPKWKTKLESPVFASPCLISNQAEIIFSEVLGFVHSLNASTGEKMWTFKTTGNIYSSPYVKESKGVNQIIFGCHDAHLYCLQYEKEPELKWKQHLDSSVFAKPSILNSSLICAATTKGFIYLCDFISGSVKTRLKLNGEVFSSPVCSNERLFVGCRDNYVYCINIFIMDG